MKKIRKKLFEKITSPIDDEIKTFNQLYMDFLNSDIELANNIINYLKNHNGKRLRPILTILSAKMCDNTVNEKTYKAAIMTEILHTASLLHDDVVDGADFRRGTPTINNIWENKTSILMGDYLFSKVLQTGIEFGGEKIFKIMYKCTKAMVGSEIKQIQLIKNIDIDIKDYFDIVNGKTASLFSISSELGCISVCNDRKKQSIMSSFGKNLGMAFQLRDDIFDYDGDEKTIGKPKGSDIREGKLTLPLIYTLKNNECELKSKVKKIFDNGKFSDTEIEKIIEIVNNSGGIEHTLHTAERYQNLACNDIKNFEKSPYKSALLDLVDYVVIREK